MKKFLVLPAMMFCLLAISAFAQNKTDFSGKWELDKTKSKLDERMRIEAMTMVVTQTEKELKIETTTKRAPRPEGETPNGGFSRDGGGRRMGGGGFGGGDGTTVYSMDGKETTVNQESPMGAVPVKLKAKAGDDGKLNLSSSRTFNSPMGEATIVTKETWELINGGKGLIIRRETDSPRGTQSSELYFTKQ